MLTHEHTTMRPTLNAAYTSLVIYLARLLSSFIPSLCRFPELNPLQCDLLPVPSYLVRFPPGFFLLAWSHESSTWLHACLQNNTIARSIQRALSSCFCLLYMQASKYIQRERKKERKKNKRADALHLVEEGKGASYKTSQDACLAICLLALPNSYVCMFCCALL